MTNLPIANNSSLLPGNSLNTVQTGLPIDDPIAGLFAALLAQQTGVDSSLLPGNAQPAIDGIATGGNTDATTTKDAGEQAAILADTQNNAANGLAAILLQLPQVPYTHEPQIRIAGNPVNIQNLVVDSHKTTNIAALGSDSSPDVKPDLAQGNANMMAANIHNLAVDSHKTANIAALGSDSSPDVKPDLAQGNANTMAANIHNLAVDSSKTANIATLGSDSSPAAKPDLARDNTNMMTSTLGKQSFSEAFGKDAIKHVELAVVSTNTTQSTTNSTQLLVPPIVMPNVLTGSRNADNPQTIGTPLASAGWASEFSQKVVWMGTQQNQIAELHLNPPDLGPLNVSLRISDNQATALFTSPHSAVRDAIENALPKLREMLADNGIMLGNATVSDQAPRDRSTGGFVNHGSGTNAHHMIGDETPKLTGAQDLPVRRHNGMVDTFA